MTRPKHTKRDLNHAEIRDGLRDIGAVVWDLADHGGECLDLMVFYRGRAIPVEVKQPGLESVLTDGERASIEALAAVGVKAVVASKVEDVASAWHTEKARWRVIDQGALRRFNDLMERVLEIAVGLTAISFATPHQKKRVCDLRDKLMELSDAFCEAVEFS